MTARSLIPRLTDIIESSELVRNELIGISLDEFETDRRKRWIVERGIEIISEASRRLTDDLKARHPEIPWTKVAGIGNVLRHNYEDVSAPVMWKLVHDNLPLLEAVCRDELTTEKEKASGNKMS